MPVDSPALCRLVVHGRHAGLLPGALLACAAPLQPWLEQSMALHMGMEIPLLFVLGWFAARTAGPTLGRSLAPCNALGIPGLAFALLATSLWMIPAALDYAVASPAVGTAKAASLVAAGLLAGASWPRAGLVVQAFFVLNGFWMTFVAGLLYRAAPQQLCSVYLPEEQALAGAATMAWAAAGLAAWTPSVLRQLRQWSGEEEWSREEEWGQPEGD